MPTDEHQLKAEWGDLGTRFIGSSCATLVSALPAQCPWLCLLVLVFVSTGCHAPLTVWLLPALPRLAWSPRDPSPSKAACPPRPSAWVLAGAPGGPARALPAWASWCVSVSVCSCLPSSGVFIWFLFFE